MTHSLNRAQRSLDTLNSAIIELQQSPDKHDSVSRLFCAVSDRAIWTIPTVQVMERLSGIVETATEQIIQCTTVEDALSTDTRISRIKAVAKRWVKDSFPFISLALTVAKGGMPVCFVMCANN